MKKNRPRQVMLCYPYERKRLDRWKKKVSFALIQPKLNGVRLMWNGGELISSTGLPVESLPHLNNVLRREFMGMELDGEGYIPGAPLQEINSICSRQRNLHARYAEVIFHVFDIPDTIAPQIARTKVLESRNVMKKLHGTGVCRVVKATKVRTHDEVMEYTADRILEGLEGSVLRNPHGLHVFRRSVDMMKVKPRHRDEYLIIHMHEGTGKYSGTLGALTVADQDGKQFNVGSFAISDDERYRLWMQRKELEGNYIAQIRYVDMSKEGLPPSSVYEMLVKPKHVSSEFS